MKIHRPLRFARMRPDTVRELVQWTKSTKTQPQNREVLVTKSVVREFQVKNIIRDEKPHTLNT